MKAELIYNPTAGALCHAPQQIERLAEELHRQGISVIPMPTRCAGHATELAQQAVEKGIPIVIVCGGDGTIN